MINVIRGFLLYLCIGIVLTACSNFPNRSEDRRSFEPDVINNYSPDFNVGIIGKNSENKETFVLQKIGAIPGFTFTDLTTTSYPVNVDSNGNEFVIKEAEITYNAVWFVFESQSNKSESVNYDMPNNPWDAAYELRETIAKELGMNVKQVVVEPNFNLPAPVVEENLNHLQMSQQVPSLDIELYEEKVWSGRGVAWHLNDDKSQLRKARQQLDVDSINDSNRVQIAHLDTGYHQKDATISDHFLKDKSMDFTQKLECNPSLSSGVTDTSNLPSHGMRTLSVLSGNKVHIAYKNEKGEQEEYDDYIGGNPYAGVREYLIGNSVIHLRPKEMTAAIKCAITEGVDVISISAGGLPSIAQRNVINDAYNNGVAVFAATGDFFKMPIIPLASTPKTVVFPARYNQVMGVAGVTYDEKSYGDSPSFWSQFMLWDIKGAIVPWMLRGSYGPKSVMKGHVISAYSPNITNARYDNSGITKIGLNGAGTSNSTPQVAAAASIWLQKNRSKIEEKGMWNSWQKAEGVYYAILKRAKKEDKDGKKLDVKKFGEGILKADDMLSENFDPNKLTRKNRSSIGYRWTFDIFKSMELHHSGKYLETTFLDMLTTESLQLLYQSKKFNKHMDRYAVCMNSSNASDCYLQNNENVKGLLDLLEGSEKVSNTFRSKLNEWKT